MAAILGPDLGGASAVAVHQDRLVLAGSSAISDLVLASRAGSERTDFRLATTDATTNEDGDTVPGVAVTDPDDPPGGADFTATAADGFWLQQTSSRQNTFHAMIQQQGLFLFGDIGEASIPAGAFTAAEVTIRENSWHGTEPGQAAVIVGGLVVFIQKDGQDVRAINWSEQDRKYIASSLLQHAGVLFEKAVDMTYAPSKGNRGDTIYVVGESEQVSLDGQMAVMSIRHEEPFYAWSKWATNGRILGAAAPLGNRVFLVERGGDSSQSVPGVVALETLDEPGTDNLDASYRTPAITETAPDNETGLPTERVVFRALDTAATLGTEWLQGLSDLDGLAVWEVENREGGAVVPLDTDALRGRVQGLPDDEPVLRVGTIVEPAPQPVAAGAPLTRERRVLQVRTRYNEERPEDPLDWSRLGPSASVEGWDAVVGFPYLRRVETLPFVARKQTGTQSRVRPVRMLDCTVDFILPVGYELPDQPDETLVRLGQVRVETVPQALRNRARNLRGVGRTRLPRRRGAGSTRRLWVDARQIIRARYGGRAGFRDRLSVAVESERHLDLAGLAYRVMG